MRMRGFNASPPGSISPDRAGYSSQPSDRRLDGRFHGDTESGERPLDLEPLRAKQAGLPLGFGVTLPRGKVPPRQGDGFVLGDADSPRVGNAQIVLSLDMALLGDALPKSDGYSELASVRRGDPPVIDSLQFARRHIPIRPGEGFCLILAPGSSLDHAGNQPTRPKAGSLTVRHRTFGLSWRFWGNQSYTSALHLTCRRRSKEGRFV